MAQLILARDALADYGLLPKPQQNKVRELLDKFTQHRHAGVHLEKLTNPRDPRVRTVRIDQQWRGIVMAPENGDSFLLVRVLTHDQADQWVQRNAFNVNAATGALEVHDLSAIEQVGDTLLEAPGSDSGALFEAHSDKDITKLGIPEELLPVVRRIADEEQLDALITVLPTSQGDALAALAAGYSVDEAWSLLVADEDPGDVDPRDIEAAIERPASWARFFVTTELDELRDVLNQPFAAWRVFLHPAQRRLAYKPVYNGPVRVTGGAGTGKTTAALHRAKALVEQAGDTDARILFTTFTRGLAAAIEGDLKLLGGPDLAAKVQVLNVDRLAYQVVQEAEGARPRIRTDTAPLWEDVADEYGSTFTPTFLDQEWRQIVLGRGISSRDAYLTTARPGRGVRLSRRQRIEVWRLVEAFTTRLVERSERTHLQLADAAALALSSRHVKPYRHVIVDEAQDLHPAQWRMLRAAVPEGPNDLFLVGDTHQRIYDNRVTLSQVGINVRGRSHRLRLNYRTTHEILRWSLGLLRGEPFDDLDEGAETLAGYRSELHGPPPTAAGFPSIAAELDALAEAVRAWIDAGIQPGEIGVTARTKARCDDLVGVLTGAGIAAAVASDRTPSAPPDQVVVATMHAMKGHEYRCVAVVDASHDRLPLAVALTPEPDDPVQHRHDVQQERCLLYVACTRARDDLRVSWAGKPSPFLAPLL